MSAVPKPPRRILIGAGSFADAEAAFRLVEWLAEEMTTELGGMLVEETILPEIASLPKQKIVTSSGTLLVAPTPTQLRTIIESDAKAFQKALSALARSRKWSFERCRGELVSGLCEAARGWDLLLLGYRASSRQTGVVLLIAPPAKATQDSVRIAGDLARALGTAAVSLSLDAPGAPQDTHPADIETVPGEDTLLARLERIHASAVVLDLSAGPLRTYDQLRRVVAAARCPVVVLGAAQGEPSIAHTAQIPPAPSS